MEPLTTLDEQTVDQPIGAGSNELEQLYLYQKPSGDVTTVPLSLRQLCRMFSQKLLTPQSAILPVANDGSYKDWTTVQEIPVLKHVLSNWWYTSGQGVQGPVSCKDLANVVYSNNAIQVFSTESCPEWTLLSKLPSLEAALQAFEPATVMPKEAKDDLEAFLTATEASVQQDEGYTSDNGTEYVRHGEKWVDVRDNMNSAAAEQNKIEQKNDTSQLKPTQIISSKPVADIMTAKKRKKSKFSAKFAKCWVYVTGLPANVTEDELAIVFGKAGLIDLDPETQKPKIKVYKDNDGTAKGDASICFARPESVDLALTLLDEAPLRPSVSSKVPEYTMRVERAKFQANTNIDSADVKRISNAKRKVAKLATAQARDWDDVNGRLTGGRKGLRIIVIKHLFRPQQQPSIDDLFFTKLEQGLREECEQWGTVEKITVFTKHPEGVVIVKFAQPVAASEAVKTLNHREHDGRQLHVSFWDGVSDFSAVIVQEEQEQEKRQEEFGSWLESQDLPEELKLKTQ